MTSDFTFFFYIIFKLYRENGGGGDKVWNRTRSDRYRLPADLEPRIAITEASAYCTELP